MTRKTRQTTVMANIYGLESLFCVLRFTFRGGPGGGLSQTFTRLEHEKLWNSWIATH